MKGTRGLEKRKDNRLSHVGHTLSSQTAQVEPLPGEFVARSPLRPQRLRGHGLSAPDIHVTQSPGQRSPTVKRELRRRAAVEPIIGHARNSLAGTLGDAINAILVGAGHNIRLLLAWLRVLLRLLLLDLAADIEADVSRQSSPPALD